MTAHDGRRVAPFGYPGITACVRLPRDYRGLPRPSSPVRAKASTVRPFFAWPDLLRPPLESPPIPLEEQAHTSDTPLVLTFPTTLPIPELSIKPEYRGVLCVTQPPHRNRGRSASRAFESRRTLLAALKEVIQPQVPLRLPCYDFAPVTELAFGGSLPLRGWVTDFGRSRLPWRDGRCVQGPGTYSPWCS